MSLKFQYHKELSEDDPTVFCVLYCRHGCLHRDTGPAVLYTFGFAHYYQYGTVGEAILHGDLNVVGYPILSIDMVE